MPSNSSPKYKRYSVGLRPLVTGDRHTSDVFVSGLSCNQIPWERAAALLKDVFDLDLEERAEVLETTVGAGKAALHRGRNRLREPEGEPASRRPVPSASLVDRFVELLNAADEKGLLALMLDNAPLDNVGVGIKWGREGTPRRTIAGTLGGHPEFPEWFHPEAHRVERVLFAGEPIVLHFHTRRGHESLDGVWRLDEEDGRLARLRVYGFCLETIREVGRELGLPVLSGLYRCPTPAPGRYFEPASSRGGAS